MKIVGLQLFLWPEELLNCFFYNDDFGLHSPDVVYVNGSYFLQSNELIPFKLGPSLRYSHVNSEVSCWNKAGKILILLPYFRSQAEEIISKVISSYDSEEVIFRFHPSSDESLRRLLPVTYKVSIDSTSHALSTACCVIGAASGSLVEALVLGIPVLVINSTNYPNYSYMPKDGEGDMWKSISIDDDIRSRVNDLIFSQIDEIKRKRFSISIRNNYFSNYNIDKLIEEVNASEKLAII